MRKLFRQEAIDAQREKLLGEVSLARPVPLWAFTAVALAFAGPVLIATGGDFTTLKLPLVGLIWGAINAASTAAMVFLPVKLIERWGNFTVNGIAFLISGLVLLPFVRPWATAPQLDWLGVGLMAFTVIGGTFGAFWLYMAGVVRVGSMRATMLGTSEPVMATITAVAWAGETFTFTDLTAERGEIEGGDDDE